MWSDAIPNLLIGLREGLEGGLITSILLVAVRRSDRAASTAPVWFGVLAAAALGLSFGAVLSFTEVVLAPGAQEALAGGLSLVAVALVTAMIFWMRSAARELTGNLQARVGTALRLGARALALTAFVAVGRESLETALFIWTTVQAAGTTAVPVMGGAVGLAVAALACVLLYRNALRLDLGLFFRRTALLLAVIAAGVLAYGLGDLQKAGLLPGAAWSAFDLSGVVPSDAWWVSVLTGITNLTPSMTVLQVLGYLGYLVAVTVNLLRQPQPAAAPSKTESNTESNSAGASPSGEPVGPAPGRARRWALVGLTVVVPATIAAVVITTRATGGTATSSITVARGACAQGWTGAAAGPRMVTVANTTESVAEVYLLGTDGGILQEIEGLGPGTRRNLSVDLAPGQYQWRCVLGGQQPVMSAPAAVTGTSEAGAAAKVTAVAPTSVGELAGPAAAYRQQARVQLAAVIDAATMLRDDLAGGRLDQARVDWLSAQLGWQRVGAAYGSFGDLATAIDGLPDALPGGREDPGFTGLRRLEHGLWNGQSAATLVPVADRLVTDLTALPGQLEVLTADPSTLPVRAHEILEDALRDRLTGQSDQGAATGYAETLADLDATSTILDALAPLLDSRRPDLLPTARRQITQLRSALDAAHGPSGWSGPARTPLALRQRIDAATGQLLETLASVPTLLEPRPQ